MLAGRKILKTTILFQNISLIISLFKNKTYLKWQKKKFEISSMNTVSAETAGYVVGNLFLGKVR